MQTIATMQGRLVPPEAGRFQSFPRARWRDEFPNAAAAGLSGIEWIVDAYGEDVNPIFTEQGLAELDTLKRLHTIATPGICADWLMDFPLLRCSPAELAIRELFLHRLFPIAQRIGARYIVLPFVDISRIQTPAEQDLLVRILTTAAPLAAAHHVELHLETDLAPAPFAALLAQLPHPALRANYDSGNSSGLGYIPTEEFAAYGPRIGSIHIKDRLRHPDGSITTMPLGQGSADLPSVFTCMKSLNYSGPITLQIARGEPGEEVSWLRDQLTYIRQYWT
jgi:hexulose-6-phosphate isomerase